MARFFIVATAKDSRQASVENIKGYGVFAGRNHSNGKWLYDTYTREEFFRKHYKPYNYYYSYDIRHNSEAELEIKFADNRKPYLQSKAADSAADDLLVLPDIKQV